MTIMRFTLVSVLLYSIAAILAGTAWASVQLSGEVGGAIIGLTGYQLEPTLAAMLLLGAILGLTIRFVSAIASRAGLVLSLVQALAITLISALALLSGFTDRISLEVLEATGISGVGQTEIVTSVVLEPVVWFFQIALIANVLWSSYAILVGVIEPVGIQREAERDPLDLWSSQS